MYIMVCLYNYSILVLSLAIVTAFARPARPILEDHSTLVHSFNFSSFLPTFPTSDVAVSAPFFGTNLDPSVLSSLGDLGSNVQPVCGDNFGTDLNLLSCHSALSGFSVGKRPISFGDRGHGFDVQLPRRLSSCKWRIHNL